MTARKRQAVPQVLETLEDRVLLAATSFDNGTLTIDFSTANETVTVSNNGTNISVSSTGSVTGAGAVFATNTITRLEVTDSGNFSGQLLDITGPSERQCEHSTHCSDPNHKHCRSRQ